jgi:GntR family transcriptional regulator
VSIDKNSPIPVYYQLKQDIKEQINQGIWKVGECIASEREITESYGVSRMTVRQALGELVLEGILIREKGKGTFVCEPKVMQKDMMSFSEIVRKNGMTLNTRVLEFKRIKTPEDLQDLILLEDVYKISRLRIVQNINVAEEIIYIPCDYCGYIDEKILEGSFYGLLAGFGYSIDHSESSMQAILMNDYYKKVFDVTTDVPLLKISSRNLTSEGKLLFVEESVYRSDKYILNVNIYMREGKIK